MTKQYVVCLQEIIVGEFEVEANSPEEAFIKAKKDYKNGRMVNEPGECQETKISILDDNGNTIIDFREI